VRLVERQSDSARDFRVSWLADACCTRNLPPICRRNAVNSLPTWQLLAAMMLSPVLAFPMPIGVEILIDFLMEVGLPAFLAFVLVGALFRKLRVRPHGSVSVET
jgi:hypothetical protein